MIRTQKTSTCLNVLQWINALRLVCNHGSTQLPSPEDDHKELDYKGSWRAVTAQKAFNHMLDGGTAVCFKCNIDITRLLGQGFHSGGQMRLSRCLRLFCEFCIIENADTLISQPLCGHQPECPMAEVSMREFPKSLETYPSTSPSGLSDMPTKIKALLNSLQLFKDTEKRFVDHSPFISCLNTKTLQCRLFLLDQISRPCSIWP
jgi:SWI/SNF-related matrix-associated actin-dependent regulator of chromatin subfamily A3